MHWMAASGAIKWSVAPISIESDTSEGVHTVVLDPVGLMDFSLTRDGSLDPVTGALWLPERLSADTPMVLCGHGASGDRFQQPIPFLAARFKERGIATLSLDGPTHGLRKVEPQHGLRGATTAGRAALTERIEAVGYRQVVEAMVLDWHSALSAVRAAKGIHGPFAYFGLSMGSIFGIPVCASLNDSLLRAAVLGLYGAAGPPAELCELSAQIRCPVAYLMQLEDELFSRQGCLDIFDSLGSQDKRLHAHPGRHAAMPVEEVDYIVNFLSGKLLGETESRGHAMKMKNTIGPASTSATRPCRARL